MPNALTVPPAHCRPGDHQSALAARLLRLRAARRSPPPLGAGSAAAGGCRRSACSTSLSMSARSSRTSCMVRVSRRSSESSRAARSSGAACSPSGPVGASGGRLPAWLRARSSSSRRVCHDPPPNRIRSWVCVIETNGRPSATSSSIVARTSSLGKLLGCGSSALLVIVASRSRAAGLGGASCRFSSDCSSNARTPGVAAADGCRRRRVPDHPLSILH